MFLLTLLLACAADQTGPFPTIELCNGVDDDLDGEIDEATAADATAWYADLDNDGYGTDHTMIVLCTAPAGHVDVAGDCEGADPTRNPGADEICNGVDDDCDGEKDEDSAIDAGTWYADTDGDGYGDPDAPRNACELPDGYVENDRDCNDDDPAVHPDQLDLAGNGVDDDCDGGIDELTLHLEDEGVALVGGPGAFGWALAGGDTDGDGQSELLVGAPDDGNGAAWLFDGLDAPVAFTGQSEGDEAGAAIAITDLDGDGFPDLAVGAPRALTVGIDAGTVYVLAGPLPAGGGLNSLRQAKLKGDDPHDLLGGALAAAGGLLLVGASSYDHDGVGPRSGAAYLLSGLPEGAVDMLDVAQAVLVGVEGGEALGTAVAAQDLDGDGVVDLALGAPGDQDVGVVWVWMGPVEGSLVAEDGLGLYGDHADDLLGTAVAVVGDLDGDGRPELALGAPGHDGGGDEAGAVMIADPLDGSRKAILLGEAAGAQAGASLAGGPDFDGDGQADFAVGAPGGPTVHLVVQEPAGTVLLGGSAATLLGEAGGEAGASLLADPDLGLVVGEPGVDSAWRVDPALLLN